MVFELDNMKKNFKIYFLPIMFERISFIKPRECLEKGISPFKGGM